MRAAFPDELVLTRDVLAVRIAARSWAGSLDLLRRRSLLRARDLRSRRSGAAAWLFRRLWLSDDGAHARFAAQGPCRFEVSEQSRAALGYAPPVSPGRAAALLLAATSVGCILFVSPPEGGDHCRFRGQSTACGVCLQSLCRTQIDGACFDEAVLAPLEQCAAAGDGACDRIPASNVATCLHERCGAHCYAKVGASVTRCTESFLSPGLACACRVGGTTNDLACSVAAYPRTRCCAPAAWPGPALECTCKAFGCMPTSDGCSCTLSDNIDADTAQKCRGVHCCAVGERCQCRTRACSPGEREVAACARAETTCPTGTSEVSGCAIRQ